MRHFKLLLAAFALMLTTSTFAGTTLDFESNRGGITFEIEKMLKDSGLIIEEEFTVRVFFKLDEDKRISIQSVKSPNEEVNAFLEKRLSNQKLHGDGWFTEKIYELPVKVRSKR